MPPSKSKFTEKLEGHLDMHPVAVFVTNDSDQASKFQYTAVNLGATTRRLLIEGEIYVMAMSPDWFTDWVKNMASQWHFDPGDTDASV